jgi:hypothetical protein
MSNPASQVLLEHLECDLGAYTGRGAARPGSKRPFSLLVKHGWRDLLKALGDRGHAPWDLVRPAVL